jgi:hypothetical protein
VSPLKWYQKTITQKSAVSIVIHRSKKFGSRKGTMNKKEKEQVLRHNIRYADIKIGDWKIGLQSKLEDRGILDWNAVDMIEMYSEWKGAWKAELTNL